MAIKRIKRKGMIVVLKRKGLGTGLRFTRKKKNSSGKKSSPTLGKHGPNKTSKDGRGPNVVGRGRTKNKKKNQRRHTGNKQEHRNKSKVNRETQRDPKA